VVVFEVLMTDCFKV